MSGRGALFLASRDRKGAGDDIGEPHTFHHSRPRALAVAARQKPDATERGQNRTRSAPPRNAPEATSTRSRRFPMLFSPTP